MVSATPSGGWLHSSPVIPKLGWPLGTRAQMFWLEEGLPSSLRPGARPRTTLSPGLALRDGRPYLSWGTPGGDQQEQWALHVFLRHVDRGLNLQEAIDAPDFHTDHLISSFYPRGFARRSITIEERFGDEVVEDLRGRGHDVQVAAPWSLGSRDRRGARRRRPAQGRSKPARHAGLRRRPLGRRSTRRPAARRSSVRGDPAARSTDAPPVAATPASRLPAAAQGRARGRRHRRRRGVGADVALRGRRPPQRDSQPLGCLLLHHACSC